MSLLSKIAFNLLFLSLFFLHVFSAQASDSAELNTISVKLNEGHIIVNTNLILPQYFIEEINQGVSKEIIFYVDLFRDWKFWPDEFVKGIKIIRTMRVNPIKREFVGTSQIGNVITEKRFKDIKTMIEWTCSIVDLSLSSLREHEQGTYFVKVSAESRIQKISPLVGYLFFFIPDKEIKVNKSSELFQIK
ncbi:MAG: DUF4390 domain-containing protein [Thermodesulfovibrionales bacterium]|nr:DUF4390 domain-containing protein [Thermodesulfovibrionales bacterium]